MNPAPRPLRIAHVVTLVSPDGAYGGPTRVAVNQAKALMDRGHEVTLLGGTRGFEAIPETYDGLPARLFPVKHLVPKSGFAGLFSVGLAAYLAKNIRRFDVVHVHLARDLVTLPAALIARHRGVPFIAQTHGMIDASSKLLARPLDGFLTRPVLSAARTVLHLTPKEASDLRGVGGNALRLQLLPNGVPTAGQTSGSPEGPLDILFLARLHARKRPQVFVEAAHLLAEEFPDATFSLVGPDEGEGNEVRALARRLDPDGKRIRLEGSLPPHETIERMRRSNIYVLPSENEPFPMSVLEAMSVGLPVVVNSDCGLSDAIRDAEAGVVVDGSPKAVADAIALLVADQGLRNAAGSNARKLVADSYSMTTVAGCLEKLYSQAKVGVNEAVTTV